ncbi:MAG: hypothetical protein VYC09_00305 [Verrucomicrobiota bacterium]|nr:hypothetical protein [Verrucomicrobiota bacterium]
MKGAKNAKSPHEAYYFYWGKNLHAVRKDNWSLHFPHSYRSLNGKPGTGGIPGKYQQKKTDIALFDLEKDISQKSNLSGKHPDIVENLKALGEKHITYVKENSREPAKP